MKFIYLLFCLTVISVLAQAQPFGQSASGYQVSRLDYQNSSGEKGSTLFQHDSRHQLVKAVWALDNKSRSSVNYYEHDSKGNLTEAFRNFSDSLTSFEFFVYNDSGYKISEHFYRSDGRSGSATYFYTDNRLVKSVFSKYKGWLTAVVTYDYELNDRLKQGIISKGSQPVGQIQYTYDSIGNLVKEFWDFNGQWTQTYIYSYEKQNPEKQYYSNPLILSSDKYRVSRENYTFNNETGGPSEYVYNESGLLIRKTFTRSDGVSTRTEYQYDENRKLISSKRTYSNNQVMNFNFQYDENNRLIGRYGYKADTLAGFETYLYNAEGKLTKAYFRNSDNWLTGDITFTSDETGLVLSGKYKGEDGTDADIEFTYNANQLLSGIKWTFSFGKFQEYRFEYEAEN